MNYNIYDDTGTAKTFLDTDADWTLKIDVSPRDHLMIYQVPVALGGHVTADSRPRELIAVYASGDWTKVIAIPHDN